MGGMSKCRVSPVRRGLVWGPLPTLGTCDGSQESPSSSRQPRLIPRDVTAQSGYAREDGEGAWENPGWFSVCPVFISCLSHETSLSPLPAPCTKEALVQVKEIMTVAGGTWLVFTS